VDKYVGKRLDGRYEIREVIGVGGMAYVYKAYDAMDDRIVAVKILKDEFLTNEDFTRRFKNESKAIAILSHPNIVKVFDVSFGARLQYIVMEYIDGITLKEYIEQQKDIRWRESVHFTVQILRALQHAHDKGIVHRDIKPQNIMLLPDGTIKVTDFGIARFARQNLNATGDADKAIGSVHYISPEQARGAITDEKADIYSVGVMLYEMLTGRLPFEADNAVSVAIMQMQAEPKKPSELNSEIPDGLEEITIKAMQKDPARRYQSAAEMLYDIDEFKRNPSIHFQYTYYHDDSPTRFVEAISRIKGEPEPVAVVTDDDDDEIVKGPPVIPIMVAVTGALVLVLILFSGFIFLSKIFGDSDSVGSVIPNFVGMKYEDIINNEELRRDYNISEENVDHVQSDKPEGEVISQDPKAGDPFRANRPTKLVVSSGPIRVKVPSYMPGDDLQEVIDKLTRAKLKYRIVREMDEAIPDGRVIMLSESIGKELAEDTIVTIFVSNGAVPVEPITMPNVTGMSSADAAVERIRIAELFISEDGIQIVNVVNTVSHPEGTVIKQTPTAGEPVVPGTVVTIEVSSGFTDATIPLVLPSNYDQPVDVMIYVDSVPDVEKSMNGILLKGSSAQTLTFSVRKAEYSVVIRIKASSQSDWQTLMAYSVSGKTGSKTVTERGEFIPPTATTRPQTTTGGSSAGTTNVTSATAVATTVPISDED